MAESPSGVEDIARRLLHLEVGEGDDVEAWARAAESACRKISDRLEPLMGRSGAAAIFGRAIVLAGGSNPAFGPVELSMDLALVLGGLRAALLQLAAPQAAAVAVGILTNVIRLLVRLLGEELAMQPIRTIWPELLTGTERPSGMETEE